MIDQTIKRAIIIPLIAVIVAKVASGAYDKWMDGTQDDMVANQEAFEDYQRGQIRTQNEAHILMAVTENCTKVLRMEMCERAKDMNEAGECLFALATGSCDMMPSVHLCGAVEQIKACADQFADAKKNGCERLRRYAGCQQKPAPADLQHLWRLKFDDGLWHGPT